MSPFSMSLFAQWNCRAARKLFAAEWDGESGPTAQKLRAHLEACPSCRDSYQEQAAAWRETRQALALYPRIAASSDFNRRVWERLGQARPLSRSERAQVFLMRPLPRLLASASFGLAVALLFVVPGFVQAVQTKGAPPTPAPLLVISDDPLSVEYAIRQRNALSLRFQSAPLAQPLPQPNVEEKLRWQTKPQSNRKPNAAGPSASHFSSLSGSLC